MTGADVTVESLDYAELQQYKLGGTEERVPRFSDALDILAAAHVPVIVEVKASPDHRRGELCRKVLEIIDAHTGNFCVESFDPFIVAWFRFHAPDLLRGQLTAQRDDLGGNLGAWLSSRMLIGWHRPAAVHRPPHGQKVSRREARGAARRDARHLDGARPQQRGQVRHRDL